jgi:hypothetical protein
MSQAPSSTDGDDSLTGMITRKSEAIAELQQEWDRCYTKLQVNDQTTSVQSQLLATHELRLKHLERLRTPSDADAQDVQDTGAVIERLFSQLQSSAEPSESKMSYLRFVGLRIHEHEDGLKVLQGVQSESAASLNTTNATFAPAGA